MAKKYFQIGDLKIEMKPSNAERITVYGEPDPILQSFTGKERNTVVATGPIFSVGGLYNFKVRILTIDYDGSFIPDSEQPEYEGWLSIGSVMNQRVSLENGGDNNMIPIQVISYYDELKVFNFDPSTKEMRSTTPFDWNISRLEENKLWSIKKFLSLNHLSLRLAPTQEPSMVWMLRRT